MVTKAMFDGLVKKPTKKWKLNNIKRFICSIIIVKWYLLLTYDSIGSHLKQADIYYFLSNFIINRYYPLFCFN